MDCEGDLMEELAFVRRELDELAKARYAGGFTYEEESEYRRLCRRENQLLGLELAS